MITYKNISFSAKTFYGVKFEPGEIKSVPGYINCQGMVRVPNVIQPEPVQEVPEEPKQEVVSEEPTPVVTRGRKKKSSEPEKSSVAENTEITILQEEISNGNPS